MQISKLLIAGLIAFFWASNAQALTVKQPSSDSKNSEVALDEKLRDNLLITGNTVRINQSVDGDVVAFGQRIEINEPVSGNLVAAGSEVIINSDIAGDAFVGSGSLRLGNDASIARDLYLASGTDPESIKRFVGGKLVMPPKTKPQPGRQARNTVVAGLTLLFTGIVLLRLFPKTVNAMATNVAPNWGKNFLAGVVTVIVTPIVAGFLIVSTIGTPIGLLLAALWLWELYVALVISTHTVGRLIMRNQKNDLIQFAAGAVVITLLGLVPGVGSAIKMILVVFGLGSIVLTKYELYRDLRSKI
ncbi:hypothetical protein HYZ64_00420 [Candidatus Berkelbacteria bacterium]|nr:hypothetical protein [Candidatus Berkelbacteria bacterium]